MLDSAPNRKTFEELIAKSKNTEREYDLNPRDPQKLNSWISALLNMLCYPFTGTDLHLSSLHDAKSKLEKAFATVNDDIHIKFELGRVCFFILDLDPPGRRSEAYKDLYDQAVKLLEEVQLKSYYIYDEEDSEEDASTRELVTRAWYEEACKNAADLFSSNPQNFENLNKWGSALMGLANYNSDPAKKVKLIEEAEAKFQAAYELDPSNVYNNWDLAKARFLICSIERERFMNAQLIPIINQLVKEAEEKEESSKKRKRDSSGKDSC